MSLILSMKSISSSQRDNILFLSTSGLSIRQIASKTGLWKSTIARVINQNIPNKENVKMGRPSKRRTLGRSKARDSVTKQFVNARIP